ncbi:MAG: mRNA-degrading endonuclease toxin of MazEF toxin-antitoxin module [Candidatus Paceibacteria bacterium]|jgi:mRNA-degrading endonuclease toxin of MazEF toxin-antitoxin module
MKKDFDKWNKLKKKINSNEGGLPLFSEREVRWCHLGVNVGHEQDGSEGFKRPVLIVRKFNYRLFWGVPLSLKIKKDNPHYHRFTFQEQEISAILSQMRPLDADRLGEVIGRISRGKFQEIRTLLKRYLK